MPDEPRPEIDTALCTSCGECVEACRFEVLKMRRDGPLPRGIGRCIVCGQCLAVCPQGAVSHPAIPQAEVIELPEAPPVSYDELMAALRSRRSVRHYADEPVAEADLRALVDAAVTAPSGHNAQPWEFTFVTSPGRLDDIREAVIETYRKLLEALEDDRRRAELTEDVGESMLARLKTVAPALHLMVRAHDRGGDRLVWDAPALAMVHAPPDAPAALPSCTYAAANMLLAAVTRGLGTWVLGFVTVPVMMGIEPVIAALGLPEGHQLHVAMAVGHPALRYRRTVPRAEPSVTIL